MCQTYDVCFIFNLGNKKLGIVGKTITDKIHYCVSKKERLNIQKCSSSKKFEEVSLKNVMKN